MQVCTSLQTDNHASTPPLSFFTGRVPFLPPNQQRQSTEGQDQLDNHRYYISRRKRRVPVCVSCIVCCGLERYKLVLQQKNWNDASLYCQTQMDSKLVVIANLEEQLALTAFLEKALGRSSVLFRDKCKKLNSLNMVLEAKSHV